MAIDMNRDGKVGCAYYVVLDETLVIQEDVSMGWIETVATLVLQAQPTTIMVPNKAPQTLTEFLEKDAQKLDDDDDDDDKDDDDAIEVRGLYILRHLVSAEFDYDAGKEALLGLYNDASSAGGMPPGEEDENVVHCIGGSNHRRLMRLEKTVNLSSHLSIGCAGAVLSDLERRRSTEHLAPGTEAPVSFRVKAITMSSQSDVMLISADALLSLQIMRTEIHPNPQLQCLGGSENKVKESLSVAGLLQALAATVQGKARLRQMLFQPSLDVHVIEERQRSIAVFLRPENSDIVASIRRQLKKVKNIKAALHHVRGGVDRIRGQLSLRINDWRALLRFTMIATQLREDIRSLAGGQDLSIYAKVIQHATDGVGWIIANTQIPPASRRYRHSGYPPGRRDDSEHYRLQIVTRHGPNGNPTRHQWKTRRAQGRVYPSVLRAYRYQTRCVSASPKMGCPICPGMHGSAPTWVSHRSDAKS